MSTEASQGFSVEAYLRVDSDWASVMLIASHPVIDKVKGFVYPPEVGFTGTQLRVTYDTPQNTTIPFIIHGNGKPIDFITAHGNASTGPRPGNVAVEIPTIGTILVNNDITGDTVNAKVFPRVNLPF